MPADPSAVDVDRYLRRIGLEEAPPLDLDGLTAVMRAHLTAVPFENLDVYAGKNVRTDLAWSLPKILHDNRGGWCFELNGAFAALLDALGFSVLRLGAAVLLDGPNDRIDHLCMEVALDEPWLVDVGFGASFITPLALNRRGPQDGGSGTYELMPSPKGTTLVHHSDDGLDPIYRFKRVAHDLADFNAASTALRADKALHWHQEPFATRLLDGGPDRVTLVGTRLRVLRDGQWTETTVDEDDWDDTLAEWFGITDLPF